VFLWGICGVAVLFLQQICRAQAQSLTAFPRLFFAPLQEKYAWHARCELPCRISMFSGKEKLIMKTVVSFLLGAVMLFGAATLGLQSATASAKDRHDRNYWRHHRHHHRHHRNHLSY